MRKGSSCIAVFFRYEDARDAIQQLLAANVDKRNISLVGKKLQQGRVAADGLASLDNDLYQLGVQEGNLHCYKCLIHGGSFLVIVNGNYAEVEHVCRQLEQHEKADVSIHFNTA